MVQHGWGHLCNDAARMGSLVHMMQHGWGPRRVLIISDLKLRDHLNFMFLSVIELPLAFSWSIKVSR